MPFDERWLTDVLARGQVRVVGGRAPTPVPQISEAAFQAAVVRLAKQHGWLVHFAYDSRRSPEGYPDLTLARPPQGDSPGRLVIAELKTQDGIVRLAQQKWLDTLQEVTRVEAAVWRPEDWETIRMRLTLGEQP